MYMYYFITELQGQGLLDMEYCERDHSFFPYTITMQIYIHVYALTQYCMAHGICQTQKWNLTFQKLVRL